jgi:uncharacterized membrane protein YdjX (TVP38/TMEM64 family)
MYIKTAKKFLFTALMIALLFFLLRNHLSYIFSFFTLDAIKVYKDRLVNFSDKHYLLAPALFVLIYIVDILFALPTAALLTVVGGFLFGTPVGAILSVIGATIGATLLFWITRFLLGKQLQERYHERLIKINQEIHHNGVYYIIILRLLPFVPFFIVSVLMGLTRISTWTFIWTTLLGIIPSSVLYALAGEQLQTITSLNDIFSARIMALFFLMAFFFVVPVVIRIARRRNETAVFK